MLTRRSVLGAVGVAGLQTAARGQHPMPGPRAEGADTPKIALGLDTALGAFTGRQGAAPARSDESGARLIRQLGVEHVLSGLGGGPGGGGRGGGGRGRRK